MSREIFKSEPYGSIQVRSYAGPADTKTDVPHVESRTRMRLEIHVHDKCCSLNYEAVAELHAALGTWLAEFGANVKVGS